MLAGVVGDAGAPSGHVNFPWFYASKKNTSYLRLLAFLAGWDAINSFVSYLK